MIIRKWMPQSLRNFRVLGRSDMNEKKYTLELTQKEMDQLVYALVLLKVDAMNCLESKLGSVEANSIQLDTAYRLLARCAEIKVEGMKR